jgi:hypothetical protein
VGSTPSLLRRRLIIGLGNYGAGETPPALFEQSASIHSDELTNRERGRYGEGQV